MEVYKSLKAKHQNSLASLTSQYNLLSTGRLVTAVIFFICFYYYTQTGSYFLLVLLILLPVAFILLLRKHNTINANKNLTENLVLINQEELDFLKGEGIPFKNGAEFIDPSHPYSYDLDFFGDHSLFQHINRAGTYQGEKQLSDLLLSQLPEAEIRSNQRAIAELTPKVEWRQEVLALSKTKPDSKKSHDELLEWSRRSNRKIPAIVVWLSFIMPALTLPAIAWFFISPEALSLNVLVILMIANWGILSTQLRKLKDELIPTNEIDKILSRYALIIKKIEEESFESEKLNALKSQFHHEGQRASVKIQKLSSLFHQMDHLINLMAWIFLDGPFLYHLHTLRSLYKWREKHGSHIQEWLQVIGTFEALNSLAHFSYNNPSYIFPELNMNQEISFEQLGHPLIKEKTRVANDISLVEHPFFILTGSNMSGKSTFLRTIGVNMVLAGMGAPVCASAASVHPLPVLVSMRVSDSLSDSESYFFAEVKRIKEIMNKLDKAPCFVLLDEILRGTNSDDKRTGTIEVIRKMVSKGALGAIATHDLEVCNTVSEFPGKLTNKSFEVEIVDNELVFDYKLRNGVCKNKSATFLMGKMGVI